MLIGQDFQGYFDVWRRSVEPQNRLSVQTLFPHRNQKSRKTSQFITSSPVYFLLLLNTTEVQELKKKVTKIPRIPSPAKILNLGKSEKYPETRQPTWQIAQEIMADVPPEIIAQLPTDGAEQHDYYLDRIPKREE